MKDQLTRLLTATPFQPFLIKMSNGEQWEVKHPENLAVGKRYMVLIEPETDRIHDLYLLHVVAFERQPKMPVLAIARFSPNRLPPLANNAAHRLC